MGDMFDTPYVITMSSAIITWLVISKDEDQWYCCNKFAQWFESRGWLPTRDFSIVACGMNQIIVDPTHYEFRFRTAEMATEFKLTYEVEDNGR